MDRLNLSSPDARDRVGRGVNKVYKKATSSIGMITSRRTTQALSIDPLTDLDLPDYIITGMEKVLSITIPVANQRPRVLPQLTYDEAINSSSFTTEPRGWAVKRMGSTQVTITFNTTPADAFSVTVEGYDITDILADDAEPFLPEDFHDLLVEGTMADELRKMEKPELASIAAQTYENRLSDLRMFISKNTYLDIWQGRDRPGPFWYRPWFTRLGLFS